MAVSLYPYQFLTEVSEELQKKAVLASIIALGVLDIGEKWVRGDLFEPWYYLLMIFYIITLAAAPVVFARPWVMRASGWILAVSMLTWSVVVRGVLAV